MSDLPYIDRTDEVKIVGQDSTGTRSNYVSADSSGNMFTVVNNGAGASAVNIQDGGNSITIDPIDGQRTTYSSAITALVMAATPTDVFTITGSGTKTVRILRIEVTGTQTTGAVRTVQVIKRSAANSGGTSSSPAIVPHDSNNAAGTAVVRAYTVNPASLGAAVGTVRSTAYELPATNLSTSSSPLIWAFGERPGQAVVLRGTSEVLAVNFNAVSSAGSSMNISIEFTEE